MPSWSRKTLTLLAVVGVPLLAPAALAAQDPEAAEARYEAAIEWVNLLVVDEDYEAAAARAHPSVTDRMTASALEQAWTQLRSQVGDLISLEPRTQAMQQGMFLVVLTGAWEEVEATDVQVFMGEDHRVAGFFVRPPSR